MDWVLIQNIAAYAIMVAVFVNGAKDIYREIKNRRKQK
jgi:hypothetical protein